MQNFTYNSNLPFDTSSNNSFPFGTQMNQQQLQLHLELQHQLNRGKKLNEDEYDYYDEEEYEDEPDEEDKSSMGTGPSALKRPKGELICVVCGAPANGYNFDAITCESCKAFFRRNAFRPLVSYLLKNNCIIYYRKLSINKKIIIIDNYLNLDNFFFKLIFFLLIF